MSRLVYFNPEMDFPARLAYVAEATICQSHLVQRENLERVAIGECIGLPISTLQHALLSIQ